MRVEPLRADRVPLRHGFGRDTIDESRLPSERSSFRRRKGNMRSTNPDHASPIANPHALMAVTSCLDAIVLCLLLARRL
jgi:hypothetical protein